MKNKIILFLLSFMFSVVSLQAADSPKFKTGTLPQADGVYNAASVTLDKEKVDLVVDWNNPFNPAKGQITKFRFAAKDRDRTLQLRVYSVSGDLVMEWQAQFALKDAWYSVDWNGTNDNGAIVGRGIYLANLEDVAEHKGVTRKVMVVK